jgi:hypothetical protein
MIALVFYNEILLKVLLISIIRERERVVAHYLLSRTCALLFLCCGLVKKKGHIFF